MKLLVINGPNINMLGIREPEIYGKSTYADLIEMIKKHADEKGVETEFFQSNHEGAIVDKIQQAYNEANGIIPKSVVKDVRDIIEMSSKPDETKSIKKMSKSEKEKLIAVLTNEMKEAAKMLEFEHAAYLRDRINKLKG